MNLDTRIKAIIYTALATAIGSAVAMGNVALLEWVKKVLWL